VQRYVSRLHPPDPANPHPELPPLPPDPSGVQFDSIYKSSNVNQVRDVASYFQFRKNSRRALCSLSHFQLRHLVKAVHRDLVYYVEDQNLMELRTSVLSDELSEMRDNALEVGDLAEIGEFGLLTDAHGNVQAMQASQGKNKSNIVKYRRTLNPTVCCGKKRKIIDFASRNVMASSLGAYRAVQHDSWRDSHRNDNATETGYVALGGFTGDFVVKNVDTNQIVYDQKISSASNSIVNCIQMGKVQNMDHVQCVVSCNDSTVHHFTVYPTGATLRSSMTFDSCINNAVLSPCGKYLLVAGDFNDVLVMDPVSQKEICRLSGHSHFSFGLSWHPHRLECASASQDKTARIFDLRKPDHAKGILKSYLGPFRSLEYSNDGELLCAAESADMVHVYDTQTYLNEQQLDVFGEITGSSFSPDSAKLFVGIHDATYYSMIEFDRWSKRSPICDILV